MHSLQNLAKTFDRELKSLADEMNAYPDEASMWKTPQGITNSGGMLALHLCGNLRHFIGSVLSDSGYVRDRRFEFAGSAIGKTQLLEIIDETRSDVAHALQNATENGMTEVYPIPFGDAELSVGQFLVHLQSHLSFHLGQLDYHRRIVTGDNSSVGPLSIPALA